MVGTNPIVNVKGDVMIDGRDPRMRLSAWKVGYAGLVLLGITYGVVVLRGPHGISALQEKRNQIQELERHNEQLHRDIEAQKRRIEGSRYDPDQQDIEIRQHLKLVKPGEKVFLLQDGRGDVHNSPRKP